MLVMAGGTPQSYQIQKSLRLRSSASAYLSRTQSTPTNNKIWTLSWWMKLGTPGYLFSAGTSGTNYCSIYSFTSGMLIYNVAGGSANMHASIPAVMRDYSSWYHVVFSIDTTQATAANRVLIWINGVAQPVTLTITPTQNLDPIFNSAVQHQIGCINLGAPGNFHDGLITETHFVDGQALTASSFGIIDSITGVWSPRKYNGTYGLNGYYLSFKNNSNTSSLGQDQAFVDGIKAQNNFWTVNSVSLTADATYDSFIDTPSNNYATLNPLSNSGVVTISNGNLQVNSGTGAISRGSIGVSTGKWYWEVARVSGTDSVIGIANSLASSSALGGDANGYGYIGSNGNKYNNASSVAYGTSYTSANIIGIALDLIAGTLTFYRDNVSQGVAYSSLSGEFFPAVGSANGADTVVLNFGQRPFTYTPPTGYLPLCTANLPAPSIISGNKYMDVALYTGNSTSQHIVNPGGLSPDLLWIKPRSFAQWHSITDTTRGGANWISSNVTNAETSSALLTGFHSTGFDTANYDLNNKTGDTHVAWQWKKGVTSGFDIVAYTGNGTNQTIAHSLGVSPKFMIVKGRSGVNNWSVYHQLLGGNGAGNVIWLNLTTAYNNTATYWNNVAPTSSVFSVGAAETNTSSVTYVAYLWAEIAGFSKFGSYTGNGVADGPFVYCGLRPRYVMIKRTTAGANWYILDTARNPSNVGDSLLFADSTSVTITSTTLDILSNGFKIRNTSIDYNGAADTYIYAVFAENPFKYSRAR